jgi:hypothetical protein
VRPQVVLQVLRDLQQHDALVGGCDIAVAAQLIVVDADNKLWLESRGLLC